MSTIKSSKWSIIAYPESLPENWKQILQDTGLPIFISPLHDKDLEIETSDAEKKSHYHIGLVYPGPTTFNVVSDLAKKLNTEIVAKLDNVRGMYEYHIHKQNPEKYQYDDKDRILLNGFDITDYKDLKGSEINRIVYTLTNLIFDNELVEYSDFMYIVMNRFDSDYFYVARSHTLYFNGLIASMRHKNRQ